MCRAPGFVKPQQQKVSGVAYEAQVLAPEDEWIAKLDHEAFRADVKDLGKRLAEAQGPEDMAHLRKIVRWQRLCSWIGALTMWYCVNPISVYLLSLGCMARWTIVAHHVCHGGFDKCSGGVYSRFKFGVGSLFRRCFDWLDWMLVEAWNVEHNQLHHYCLGEVADPDLVEENLKTIRALDKPLWFKRLIVVGFMFTWKWTYYAPNTFKMLKIHELRRQGKVPTYANGKPVSEHDLNAPWSIHPSWLSANGPVFYSVTEFLSRVLGPYFVRQFVLIPGAVGLLLGGLAMRNALVSLVLAELLTNVHSFLVIVTNHAGDDLYRFERHCAARTSTFYLRQIISSVNFSMGTDLIDFHHGWLNYQIEHHLWPDLSMLSYQRAAPMLKAVCKKHGVPYVQHSVWWRLKKTVDIMIGSASMRRYPRQWEREQDLAPLDAAPAAAAS